MVRQGLGNPIARLSVDLQNFSGIFGMFIGWESNVDGTCVRRLHFVYLECLVAMRESLWNDYGQTLLLLNLLYLDVCALSNFRSSVTSVLLAN